MPGYQASIWWAWGTRAGTPQSVLSKMNSEIAIIQKLPDTEKLFAANGAEVLMATPAELRVMMPKEIAKWTKVAAEAKMAKN